MRYRGCSRRAVHANSGNALAAPDVPHGAKDCHGFRAVGSGLTESIASLMAPQGAVNVA